ncbi:uncharacterized protein E0L32_006959 [Thyridium curvatum]|uniref:Ketoreductase domain-containing protein n=1 Tax=Thyridium curvatum TaxID=1093900 RepID=A0A507AQQ2_9PEZI|nr:uncharacterized protein E0L32_006959 [Thyridium curvatum]TPX12312.1 hypothetical protein E0L32_006959 [Thyridium curvatum]
MAVASKDDVKQIFLTEEERKNGRYSPRTLVEVLEAMNQDGLVVLKGVIPVETINKLNKNMCADADRRILDPSQSYNHGLKSNILQRPPVNDPEYLSKDVYFNPYLLQLANAYLGHRPVWNWLTANTALAHTGGMRQPVHKDCNFDHPLFPYIFIANIPLCDFSTTCRDQEVASTPESIRPYPVARVGESIPPITTEAKERRLKVRPPIQPACYRGDIMVRDIRTWHAGMPNSSGEHRIMLGLGYQSPSYPNYTMRLHLPYAQREFFLQHGGDLVDVRSCDEHIWNWVFNHRCIWRIWLSSDCIMSPKVFIVTGASKGIGAAIAQRLLSQSHNVVLVARSQEPLEAVKKSHSSQVEYVAGDVTDASVARKIIDVAITSFGHINGLVLNHGVLAPKKLSEVSVDEFRQVYDVNVFSQLAIAKEALVQLRKSKGCIIWISAATVNLTFVAWASYSSSKAAVNVIATHLAAEEPDIISVSIEPGRVDTDMQAGIRSKGKESMDSAIYDNFVDTFNQGGLLRPEQPANVIAGVVAAPFSELSGKILSWDSPELACYQE